MRYAIVIVILLTLMHSFGCTTVEPSRNKASYHYKMGRSYLAEGNYTKALIEFTDAEKITPNDPVLLNYLGQTYFFKKRFDLAEAKYLRAIDLRPSYSEARTNLGAAYLEMQRWDSALKQLTLAYNDLFFPEHDTAAVNLALAYYGKGEYVTALSFIRPVVERHPRDLWSRLNLGRIYFADGKTSMAIEEFRKCVELAPNYAKAHYQLALAYLKYRDFAAAKKEFLEVVRTDPDGELGRLSKDHLRTLR